MEDGDREGAYYSGGILFFVGLKLSSQAKINGAHGVESWVWTPHGRKDLSHGVDVLLHALFVNGIVVGCKDVCAELLSKDF